MSTPNNGYDLTEHRKNISDWELSEAKKVNLSGQVKEFSFSISIPPYAIFIYRSHDLSSGPHPTLIYIAGTGFIASTRFFPRRACIELAKLSRCQVIEIKHRLAPENPCPTAIDDVYNTYTLIVKNSKRLKVDLNKLAICGYSSGGNLAALTAIKAKEENLPLFLQILISPLLDLSRSLNHFKCDEDKDGFSNTLAQWFIDSYLQQHPNRKDPRISPYWSDNLNKLPPTYLLVGQFDRFRSDTEAYFEKLNKLVWAHKSVFKEEKHTFFWKRHDAVETVAIQSQYAFYLFSIPPPLEKKNPVKNLEKNPTQPSNLSLKFRN